MTGATRVEREPGVHVVETVKYIAAVGRMIRAAGRRAGDGDEFELAALLGLADEVESAVRVAVGGQRARGRSWAFIAFAAGLSSREAAFKRWGKRKADAS